MLSEVCDIQKDTDLGITRTLFLLSGQSLSRVGGMFASPLVMTPFLDLYDSVVSRLASRSNDILPYILRLL
jgi:hypothetical protein